MLRPIVLVLTSWACLASVAGAADTTPAVVETVDTVPDRSYLVFFDFDSSRLTPEAQQVVASAAADALQGRTTRIDVTGHTDRSGSVQYNQALSVRRGESIRRELVADGVADSLIAVKGVGESDPLVPTADGVREPQNRRVEIVLLPTRPAPAAGQSPGMRGIWGAIAYSVPDEKRGFFWGADKPEEAQEIALRHCVHRGGQDCKVVSLFRNHRHWDDDDKTGFPYEHCAALAVGKPPAANRPAAWGAASAETRRQAEEKATAICGGDANECEIPEWVCT
ncbi:OmpA family protein [Inquilinus limosus]|uniref:OmpA family protein n=1 Tax=Inquilinus limosus TaxID=171674 RepID=UPI003F5CD035